MKKVSGLIDVPGMGQNLTDTVLQDVKNFTGDFMTDIILLVDESTSIGYYGLEGEMANGIVNIKNDLIGTKNADSIRICVLRFGANVPKDVDFVPLEKMDTSYSSHQRQTRLYETICVANNLMLQHIEAMEEKNVYVNGLVIVATDGEDVGSARFYDDAKEAIRTLHGKEVDFQYICIGADAINCAYGLGLKDDEILKVEDTNDPHKVRKQWAMASASAKSASQKAAAGSSIAGTSTAGKFNIDDD